MCFILNIDRIGLFTLLVPIKLIYFSDRSNQLKLMLFSDIRDEVKRALKNHTMRFKTSKRQTIEMARLKVRAPPNAPVIALPPGPKLSEKYLNDLFCDQARIHFLPREV